MTQIITLLSNNAPKNKIPTQFSSFYGAVIKADLHPLCTLRLIPMITHRDVIFGYLSLSFSLINPFFFFNFPAASGCGRQGDGHNHDILKTPGILVSSTPEVFGHLNMLYCNLLTAMCAFQCHYFAGEIQRSMVGSQIHIVQEVRAHRLQVPTDAMATARISSGHVHPQF